MKTSVICSSILVLGASAQQSWSYRDSKSGITFQTHTETAGFAFGIALPEAPSTDFIGYLVGKGRGYAAVSLAGPMVNSLLIAAWPSGTSLVSSFRTASSYHSPQEAKGAFTLTPIASGTYTNSTHYAYTFLCERCITSDGTTFASNATVAELGWALSEKDNSHMADHGARLTYHDHSGTYHMDFAAARSASYPIWASKAGNRSVGSTIGEIGGYAGQHSTTTGTMHQATSINVPSKPSAKSRACSKRHLLRYVYLVFLAILVLFALEMLA